MPVIGKNTLHARFRGIKKVVLQNATLFQFITSSLLPLSCQLNTPTHYENVMQNNNGIDMRRKYKLLSPQVNTILSDEPGQLGGNSKAKIYGKLDCSAANRALSKGYANHRVFFANESDAISAGYRPCGSCMGKQYNLWKAVNNA